MISFIELEIISVTILAALACTVPGTIIFLKRDSGLANTATVSSALGFAAGFASLPSASASELIPFGAAASLFGIWIVKRMNAEKITEKNIASVAVPSAFFAAGALIISNFTNLSDADMDVILAGDLAFAPFDRITAAGYDVGPSSIYILGAVLVFNVACALIFHKEIKLSAVDEDYARNAQLPVNAVYGAVFFMTALTAASVFRVTGAFMTAAFMLAPPLTAGFYARRLCGTAAAAAVVCVAACLTGFGLAYKANVHISGAIVCVMGAFFIISAVAAPEKSMLRIFSEKRKSRLRTGITIAAVHLFLREKDGTAAEGCSPLSLCASMAWSRGFADKVIASLEEQGLARIDSGTVSLTKKGRIKAAEAVGIKYAA